MLDKLKSSSGLTLMELFVALFLVSLLMVFIVSANLFVKRVINDWEDDNVIYEDGRFILNLLTGDLRKTTAFSSESGDSLYLITSESDTVLYSNINGGLFKKSKRLNSANVQCDSIRLVINDFDKTFSDSILINDNYFVTVRLTIIKLWLSYKGKQEYFETSARLKNESFIY